MSLLLQRKRWTSSRILCWLVVLSTVGVVTLRPQFIRWRDSRPAKIDLAEIQGAVSPPRFDGSYPCVSASVLSGRITTGLSRCQMPTEHVGKVDRFEADLRYGTFVLRRTDLEVRDGIDVPLTRTYSSRNLVSRNPVYCFGRNTNQPYDMAPVGTRFPYTYLLLVLEDGDILYFKRVSPGTGFSDAVYLHTETSTRFYKSTLAWNGKGWTLRLADGGEMRFPESYGATNLAQGAASQIIDSQGNVLSLERDAQRNLTHLITPHNRGLRLTYDAQSRIIRAEDDNGDAVTYRYNGDNLLTDEVSSSGSARHYEYDKDLLTSVRDEQGKTLVENRYESGTLIGQTYGNGDVYRFRYLPNPATGWAKTVVSLPDDRSQTLDLSSSVPEYLLHSD